MQLTRLQFGQCGEKLIIDPVPLEAEQLRIMFWQKLTTQTQAWLQRFQDGGFDADTIKELPDAWLDMGADPDPKFGTWLESVYISWGEQIMPDVLAEFIDGS